MNIDAAGKKACWELGRFFILMFYSFLFSSRHHFCFSTHFQNKFPYCLAYGPFASHWSKIT